MPVSDHKNNNRRVLVLDDDRLAGETIYQVVTFAGYEAQHIYSANVLFEQYNIEEEPTILILDLLMPDIDGVEVLSRLAHMDCSAAIIITSGVGPRILDAAARSATEHGLNVLGVLSKPFSPSQLRGLLAKTHSGESRKPAASPKVQYPGVSELKEAISSKQLTIVFQPKVVCKTGTLAGFESLTRWQHNGVTVPPDHFIKLAEDNGLIDELTKESFEQSLAWFAWLSGNAAKDHQQNVVLLHTTLSLNISAITLSNGELFKWLVNRCDELGIERKRLILELTESTAMRNAASSLETLTRLRMQGFQLSIDDFGTGFSSMLQLVRLPFSEIKVDKSFVTFANASIESKAVTRSIVDLGHSLGLVSTAEGIEDQETLNFLRDIGCDLAQGYFISPPLAPQELFSWFRTREQAREQERLELLSRSGIIEQQKTRQFDRIVHLAADLLDLPSAFISIIGENRRWIKSSTHEDEDMSSLLPILSQHTLQQDTNLAIEDIHQHPLFKHCIAQAHNTDLRFYAGSPLCLPNGTKMGALEVASRSPRSFGDWEDKVMTLLKRQAETELAFVPHAKSSASLPDRYMLKAQFNELTELASLAAKPLTLLLLVLDELGDINRWRGRHAGDRFLEQVTAKITASLHPCDLVGRYRGGELLIVLWDTTPSEIAPVLDGFRVLAAEWNSAPTVEQVPLHLLISSVGIDTAEACDFEETVEQARANAIELGHSIQLGRSHDA